MGRGWEGVAGELTGRGTREDEELSARDLIRLRFQYGVICIPGEFDRHPDRSIIAARRLFV